MNDIYIKNGTLIDGTGRTPRQGNIAVKGGKITAIGQNISENAKTIIDAAGLFVCPGFIDITNHSDTHWTLFDYPTQQSMLRQGITSIIGGSCGASLAPLLRGSVSATSIQKWVDTSVINVNWLSMKEYLEELSRHDIGVHVGTLAGHSTLRRNIMGDAVRPANADELDRMGYLLDQTLTEHAFGLSLGLAFSHGKPATDEELILLAAVVAKHNRLLTVHLRDEGKDLLPAVAEIVRIARATNVRTHIVHFKALGRKSWEYLSQALQLLRTVREEGVDISVSTFPYQRTGSLLYALLPSASRDGGKDAILQRISDPKQRLLLLTNLQQFTLHYNNIIIASAKETPDIVGKSIQDLAKNWDMSGEEAMLEILAVNQLAVTIFSETINKRNTEAIYLEPYAFFATDGIGYEKQTGEHAKQNLVHPRSFGATARFLGEYTRDQSLFSWESAVAKMTKAPADALRITNRGVLAEDAYADITIFNPKEISGKSTFSDPYQYPTGIPWVLVNGKVAVENGSLTDVRAGTTLTA